MDSPTRNEDQTQWVDARLASLAPPTGWKPDVERAFEQVIRRRNTASTPPWLRLALAGALLASIGVVVLLIPWRVLWEFRDGGNLAQTPQDPATAALDSMPRGPEFDLRVESHSEPGRHVSASPAGAEAGKQQTPGGVTEPIVLSQVQPEYSKEGREAKIQGTVELLIIVNSDGTVRFDSVRKGLGYGLDEKAIEAVEQWRFVPGKKDGKPVPTMVSVLINFSLR